MDDPIAELTRQIAETPRKAALYLERGKLYQAAGEFGRAMNDYTEALQLEPENAEAKALADMLRAIFEYRYTDIYNP